MECVVRWECYSVNSIFVFLLNKNRKQSIYFGFIIENWGHSSKHFVVIYNLSAKSLLFPIDGGVTKLIQIAIPHLYCEVVLTIGCEWNECTEKLKDGKFRQTKWTKYRIENVFLQRIHRCSILDSHMVEWRCHSIWLHAFITHPSSWKAFSVR